MVRELSCPGDYIYLHFTGPALVAGPISSKCTRDRSFGLLCY
jgi:hypothetical protein